MIQDHLLLYNKHFLHKSSDAIIMILFINESSYLLFNYSIEIKYFMFTASDLYYSKRKALRLKTISFSSKNSGDT
jgi:hypothetical protein